MIYFITARDIGRVKIGYSADPARRFSKVQSDSPVNLALERVCPGCESEEARLHTRFADYRLSGEWFALAGPIEAHMETLPAYSKTRRERSLAQIIVDATGMTKSYATQILSDKYPHQITIPIAISVFQHCGQKIGPIETATAEEIAVLEKFCGPFRKGNA